MKRRVYSNALGSRAARTSAALAFSLLPIEASLAQNEDADALADLQACAAIERSNARLACYDGVLGRTPSPPEPAATTAANPAPPPEVPTSVAPDAAAGVAPPPRPAADNAPQAIVVTELRLRGPTTAVFVTANGQVWDQIDNGRGRYPEVPFEATLERGSFSSMFLISPAGGPRIRVRLRE
jgi:hypothetical protein